MSELAPCTKCSGTDFAVTRGAEICRACWRARARSKPDEPPATPDASRDLRDELVAWVRTCRREDPSHVLAALAGVTVTVGHALHMSTEGFLRGLLATWELHARASASRPADVGSVDELLRRVREKAP